jgi:hypothetical protein
MAEKDKPTPKEEPKAPQDKAKPDGRKSPFTEPEMQHFHGSQDKPRGRRPARSDDG